MTVSDERSRILIANDDGIASPGLAALAEAMEPLGEVWVAAPEQDQSAAGHALSLQRPLRIRKARERWYAIDGTPADCVYMGIHHLLRERHPVLVVSGINLGANLANDVIYSGTVAAAMEGAMFGIPSIAFSLVSRGKPVDLGPAAAFARQLARSVLESGLSPRTLLNVNVPGHVSPRGWAVTRLGRHAYENAVIEKTDPRGRRYYWIGGSEYAHEPIPGSDCTAVLDEACISVTPLMLDVTDGALLPRLSELDLDGFSRLGAARK